MEIEHHELVAFLRRRLAGPLPGPSAQRAMEPPYAFGRHRGPIPSDARRAAVLALLYQDAGLWRIPLTKRSPSIPRHAGQVSLPGGAVEPGETTSQGSRREFAEELGVQLDPGCILGKLSPVYVWASNFAITPHVAVLPHRPTFAPNLREVAEILEIPLEHLRDAGARGTARIRSAGMWLRTPHFAWRQHRVWGATAMILAELLALLDELPGGQARVA